MPLSMFFDINKRTPTGEAFMTTNEFLKILPQLQGFTAKINSFNRSIQLVREKETHSYSPLNAVLMHCKDEYISPIYVELIANALGMKHKDTKTIQQAIDDSCKSNKLRKQILFALGLETEFKVIEAPR